LEETVPTTKKDYRPAITELNLLTLPESMKMERRSSSQKTISMSKFGSRIPMEMNSMQMMARKNTSSLVNQILNKQSHQPKKLLQHHIATKHSRK
jgi:GTPase SAR1 family protein